MVEFKCPICGKVFYFPPAYEDHMWEHFRQWFDYTKIAQDVEKLSREDAYGFLKQLEYADTHISRANFALAGCIFISAKKCIQDCRRCDLHGCAHFALLKAILHVLQKLIIQLRLAIEDVVYKNE